MISTRVDKWLWSVRLYSTRSQATAACNGGHVQINGNAAKPSSLVRVGDSVEAYSREVHRVLIVQQIIEKRVGAAVAVECYSDQTPPAPPAELRVQIAVRDSGSGRPTKKDRRDLEKFHRRQR
ncbi:heat shock protein Hsp15 [Actinobacteria bacterium IMCC26207]|nr:heat shock protein Hsp15 [Actinobacteria bacterium IMCC26207]